MLAARGREESLVEASHSSEEITLEGLEVKIDWEVKIIVLTETWPVATGVIGGFLSIADADAATEMMEELMLWLVMGVSGCVGTYLCSISELGVVGVANSCSFSISATWVATGWISVSMRSCTRSSKSSAGCYNRMAKESSISLL